MAPSDDPSFGDEEPLYNSRLVKVYLGCLSRNYPDLDIDPLLNYAGIAKYEVEDPAHWFTQTHMDRFNKIMISQTGNPNIAREGGRHATSSGELGGMKQYLLGLLNTRSIYLLLGKLYPMFSRGATAKVKKIAHNRVEVITTPRPNVKEKPYQCENRMGILESLSTLFTKKFARIDHTACIHRGDSCCRYLVSWDMTPSLAWKQVRNTAFLAGLPVLLVLFFLLPLQTWGVASSCIAILLMGLSLYAERLESMELSETIQTQGNSAQSLLEEFNFRYNNALLVQEIGQATSTILETDRLIHSVLNVMQKRLDFDRGLIMLANKQKTRLVFRAGYGYDHEKEDLLSQTSFHLNNPDSRGIFVLSFKNQEPFLINDISEIRGQFSSRSQELARRMGVQSLVCAPLVYQKESLGILAVDNVKSKRQLTPSDMSLLIGVASQTAVSIVNAVSFEKIRVNEKKYRDLVENANSIILRMDTRGEIIFFNEFAQKFFGYTEEEIIGRNVRGTILPDSESTGAELEKLVLRLQKAPEQQVVNENENVLRNGDSVWIAWTYKPIFDATGRFIEILSIGNDITELKRAAKEKKDLEIQLQRAQKMEAIGTLAGGISHDFNNILQVISGYTQLLMMSKSEDDPDYEMLDTIENSVNVASDLTKRLLIFSRKVESELRPVDLNREVVEVSRMLERTIPKMITIELHLAANLKTINADTGQIEQVLMNLGLNARDAMPDGGKLTFKTENVFLNEAYSKTHLGSPAGEYVLLSVSDSGCGIDQETMEHIFEPFFSTKETGKGSGLGLAMVYGIVKSHNGHIACESAPGKGTTFKVYFPLVDQKLDQPEIVKKRGCVRGGSETILLVDDEKNILDIGKKILTRHGYRVLTANDGESALDFYRKEFRKVDLVILDLNMPGMGGIYCLKEMLKIKPESKVIIASGYSLNLETRETVDGGAKGYVPKPYDLNQMLDVVRGVLNAE